MTPEARLQREFVTTHGTATAPVRSGQTLLERTIQRGVSWLLAAQEPDGYWWGRLEADSTLESDHIMFELIQGHPDPDRIVKLANHIRSGQQLDGGWPIYPGGPSEINATVKAYVALKLAGDGVDSPHLMLARSCVHRLGGLERTNSYSRFYLALMGALDWDLVPAIPPELMLLPKWFFVNLYEMSSWTRAIVVPLTILWALKPTWKISPDAHVDELFRDPAERAEIFEWDPRIFSWRTFFLIVDRVMKFHEALPVKPFRRIALRKAKKWVEEHLDRSDGLATIYPAMLNSVLAMNAMGRKWDDPAVAREVEFIKSYEIENANTLRIQPCISPVWDTAIAMVSLEEAGLPANHPALARGAEWLMKNQITTGGDWQVKNRDAAPGGWAFEFRNEFFPDVDDTAFVLMALARAEAPNPAGQQQALERGLGWLLSMQNGDGGWGAFDRDNNLSLLNHIPFADHNAMLDPSTADVTARAIECLGQMGWTSSEPAVQRGWNFIRNDQCTDGSWYGRWGVNYVYGSSGVLRAMGALRMNHQTEAQRSGEWLRQVQNLDGGFGETPASYEDPSLKGKGESTASQTAWGLIGLLAAFGPDDPSVKRAVNYLTQHQRADGTWEEHLFTGTGFPQVFYLQYHLYRNSFPVYALARYRNMVRGTEPCKSKKVAPRDIAHLYRTRGD